MSSMARASDASENKQTEPNGQHAPSRSFVARCIDKWSGMLDHLSSVFLGGPRCIKYSTVVNFQKCTTLFLCMAMMVKSHNFTTTATTYTALHGSYGLCWYMKHLAFPDPRWESDITLGSAAAAFTAVLGPYWVIAYNAIIGGGERSNTELCAATIIYAVGLVLMIGADVQKYFVLKERKGLITDGFFARTRNPNYLGEVMIYGSFAYVSAHASSWAIVGCVWTFVFLPFMLKKDERMRRHAEWKAYASKTGLFFPRLF